jgi:hypothetical protein
VIGEEVRTRNTKPERLKNMREKAVQIDLEFVANAPLGEIKSGKIFFDNVIIGSPRDTMARTSAALERMGYVGIYTRCASGL